MVLNHEQIKSRNIIGDFTEIEFSDGSYNLTVNQIIDMNSKVSDSFTLKPQGMVYVVFKEKLNLPPDIIGFVHVKTAITRRGIMATNIGIIDPNYIGYISTLLINFGKSDYFLSKGDAALRVTFSNMAQPVVQKKLAQTDLPSAQYIKNTQKNIVNLDEKFLNLNAVEKAVEEKVKSSVFTTIRNFVGVFTVASFLVAAIFQYKNSQEKDLDRSIKQYETGLSTISENNKLLQEKLNTYDFKLKGMQDSITAQANEIKKLKK